MKIVDGAWNGSPITRLELSARAAAQILNIDSLKCIIDQNQLTLTNGIVPIPELKKKAWLPLLAASRATAHLRLTSPSSLPAVWSEPFLSDWQELGLELASADLTLQDNHLRIPQAEISGQAGHLEIKDAELNLASNFRAWQEVPVSMRLQLALNDAAVVHHFYKDWPATGGKAQAKGSFAGSLAQPHLPFAASFTGASIAGISLATVAGKGEWSKDRLALDLTMHNREHDQLTFQGTIDLDQGGLLTTKISTDLADMHTYLPKSLVGNTMISGSLLATASLAGPFSELSGALSATGDWSIQGTELSSAALDTSFKGHKLSLKRLSMTIDDAVSIDTAGRLTSSQDWASTAVDLDRLGLSFQEQELDLTSPGSLTLSTNAVTVRSPLSFSGPLGRFRLQSSKGKSANLTLVAENLRDTGLLKKVSGRDIGFAGMNFTLDMNGPLNHPAWRWQGNIQGLAVNGPDLSMDGTFDMSYGDTGLRITQCTLANTENSIKLAGQLPLTFKDQQWIVLPSPLQMNAKIDLPKGGILPHLFPEWLTTSGDVRADLEVHGTMQQPIGQIQFSGTDLKPGTNLALLPPGPFDSKALLKIEQDQVLISQFEISSPGLTLQTTGVIDQLPLSILFDNRRDSLPGQIALNGHYTMPALDWLATKVPALRRTKGTASGTFFLNGPFAHPEVKSTLFVKNGAARGSDSLLVFRDITLEAVLEQNKLTIQSLSGTLGGSPLQISGQVNAPLTDTPELDLQLAGKDLLLYRADGFKIRADTTITLTGTVKAPQFSGEILLTDSKISKRVDWLSFLKPGKNHNGSVGFTLFSFTEAPLKDARLNLRIKAAQPLLITNNVFKGGVRPDLLLTGTGEVPYLKGVIYADEGRITLPAGRLDLERGLIRFAENAPDRPQLEFQAGGRMMAYDITAQIRGTYDEPEVTLSSVPPLANDDLLMLLLTGRPPVNTGQANSSSGVSTVAVYFGRGLLTRLFGEEADQLLLLDLLEVDVGRAVTQQGEPTLDAKIKLADDVWLVDTSYYLTGEKDIWDYYNAGLRAVFHFR
ncbi:MAG: translocation/assembly module TamB domain-containing protein, partial [Desulfobulbaceae bacterium]|nr:translocation/assembly module TamB domain-containing protein [Desulfobulbaceae bacterium]